MSEKSMAPPDTLLPKNIDWVDFTEHAKQDKISEIGGVSEDFVVGRVLHLGGHLYLDETESKWELYLQDYEVAIKLDVAIEQSKKVATVVTVMENINQQPRYHEGDRFERWWL